MKKIIFIAFSLLFYQVVVSQTDYSVHFSASPTVAMFPNSYITIENLSSEDLDCYVWDFGEGDELLIDSTYTSNYANYYDTWGIYTIILEGFLDGESIGTYSQTITIGMPDPVLSGYQDDVYDCNNETILYASILFDTERQWYFNGFPILDTGLYAGVNSYELIISNPTEDYYGMYYCVGSNDSGSVTTPPVSLLQGEEVVVQFEASPLVTTYPNSNITIEHVSDEDLNVYVWNFDDGYVLTDSSYSSNYMHHYSEPGIYTIELTGNNGMCSDTYTQTITILAPSSNTETTSNIAIYPNPTTGKFTISETKGVDIEIFDITGKKIRHYINISENKLDVDFSDEESGIYIIKLFTGNITKTTKIILE